MWKRVLDLNFNYTVIYKISNFHKIAPNISIYLKKLYFFKAKLNR